MQDRFYFGTNTKMFKTAAETVDYLRRLEELTHGIPPERAQRFVIPSYTSLGPARAELDRAGSGILLGAQNMGWEERGQYTGEISPLMLREAGARLVMVGHSERRHTFRETDAEEEKKVRCALDHGFRVLLCVGEQLEDRRYGTGDEVLRVQLKIGLHQVRPGEADRVWVAYEPVWAIGVNGIPADEGYAGEKHRMLRGTMVELFGEAGSRVPLLYGGSVNPENAVALSRCEEIDGLFIGRSAWDAERFADIMRAVLASAA